MKKETSHKNNKEATSEQQISYITNSDQVSFRIGINNRGNVEVIKEIDFLHENESEFKVLPEYNEPITIAPHYVRDIQIKKPKVNKPSFREMIKKRWLNHEKTKPTESLTVKSELERM